MPVNTGVLNQLIVYYAMKHQLARGVWYRLGQVAVSARGLRILFSGGIGPCQWGRLGRGHRNRTGNNNKNRDDSGCVLSGAQIYREGGFVTAVLVEVMAVVVVVIASSLLLP